MLARKERKDMKARKRTKKIDQNVQIIPKICFLDIETTNLDADFGTVLCVSWKWSNEKKVNTIKITDYKNFKRDPSDDKSLLKDVVKELSKADVWCGWYSSRFDIPFLNSRLLYHRLSPLPPIPHVDCWRIARYKMKLSRNSLMNVSTFLEIDEKTPLTKRIWMRARTGHIPSINYICRHCVQDVLVLEQAYNIMKPLMTNHPNLNLIDPKDDTCPICNVSNKLQKRGFQINRSNKYQRYQCTACGGWSRSRNCEKQIPQKIL